MDSMPPNALAPGLGIFAAAKAPLTPLAGTDVAAMVPLPVAARLAPDPTTNALDVLVPDVSAENADEPLPQGGGRLLVHGSVERVAPRGPVEGEANGH